MSGKSAKKVTTLEELPRVSARHTWADYVELLCLFNVDREMSKDVLIDRFKERGDTGELVTDEQDDTDDGKPVDEALREKAEELFRHLKYREGAFGRKYPFTVDMTHRRLSVRQTTGGCRLYLFLLLASNLRYFDRLTPSLTSDFEWLGGVALKRMLPKTARVHLFHGAKRKSGRYRGKLLAKLKLLSEDIFERLHDGVDEDDFSQHDVGDAGLDLVAWIPMGDDSPGLLLCMAQCACTDKWVTKQHAPLDLRQIMTLKALPANFTFIPFCFRRPTGGWFHNHKVNCIVVDRLRLVHLLDETSLYRPLASLAKIDALIKGTEPLF